MMKKMKSKKVKGMTLIEIIIAILVLGIMGVIMARIATAASKQMMSANHMERKTAIESPMAANQATSSYDAEKTDTGLDLKITGSFDTVNMKVDKYTTKQRGETEGDLGKTNVNADLYYYSSATVSP